MAAEDSFRVPLRVLYSDRMRFTKTEFSYITSLFMIISLNE